MTNELNQFLNQTKRRLLRVYASYAERLLDLGCGPGSDIQHWVDCHVLTATGIDHDQECIDKAQQQHTGPHITCSFHCRDASNIIQEERYDVVTSMFSIQYFCKDVTSLRKFLQGVSTSLRYHGHFVACFPDAHRVQEWVKKKKTSDYVDIKPVSSNFAYMGLGREYTITTRDGTSHEYLVDLERLKALAAEYGLLFKESRLLSPATQFAGDDIARLYRTFVCMQTTLQR